MSRIVPPVTELTRPYWDGCAVGELRLQRCRACDRHQFYPRTLCVHCGEAAPAWDTSSGRGVIASFTVVRRAISGAYAAPYVVALVRLEEGPVMMSNIIDADPAEVAVGAPVAVDFETWSDDITLPVFRMTSMGDKQ